MRHLRDTYYDKAIDQSAADLDAVEVEIDQRPNFSPEDAEQVQLVTLFMVGEGLGPAGNVRMTVQGIVFLILAAVMLLRTVIEQTELRTREKLLEIQYELAELREAMKDSETSARHPAP